MNVNRKVTPLASPSTGLWLCFEMINDRGFCEKHDRCTRPSLLAFCCCYTKTRDEACAKTSVQNVLFSTRAHQDALKGGQQVQEKHMETFSSHH